MKYQARDVTAEAHAIAEKHARLAPKLAPFPRTPTARVLLREGLAADHKVVRGTPCLM